MISRPRLLVVKTQRSIYRRFQGIFTLSKVKPKVHGLTHPLNLEEDALLFAFDFDAMNVSL